MSSGRDEGLDRLRVSNIQRENAVTTLRDAAADGRLDFDELGERVAAALTAITRGDLVRLLDDLVPPDQLDAVIADPQVQGEGPGFRWDSPLVIEVGWNSARREGPWQIPPFIEVLFSAGTVVLDCLEAVALAPIIDITLVSDGWGGAVKIVVPDDWGVDTQHVMTSGSMGTVSSKVRTRPLPGKPRCVLRGRISGSLTVRHANGRERRRLAKAQAARPALET